MKKFKKLTNMVKALFSTETQKLIKVGFLSLDNGDVTYTPAAREALIDILLAEYQPELVVKAEEIIAKTLADRKASKCGETSSDE